MGVKDQKKILAEMDRMNGRRVAALGKRYKENVIGPMVAAIKKAKSPKDLLKRLGPGLVKKMDATVLEEAVADTTVQASLIGRATAMPRGKAGD